MDSGIIRVGGRLAHGYSMTDDQRFPLLVSHRSKLATLAINDAHKRTLHGGPTATVAEMRRQIWIIQAVKKASACIKKCLTCFLFNSGPTQQLMGDLPASRIEVPESAFSCVGLDFAGPLTFKNGTECVEGYVAVFICFLTYEEMTTILCQIEQVLNNRPLMALTNNPDDIFALTPSMLVNGSRLDAIPQPCLQTMDARGHPAKRFRALQQLLSQFGKRWASEYVASLHSRGKWRQERANLSIDDVVLITDDGIPPRQWSIGRVMQLKLGHDCLARVTLVRTSRGEFTRPVSKLRRLPIKDNDLHKANIECTQ